MSLDIYREVSTGIYVACSRDGVEDGLLPVITTHDGTLGEVVETRLFVRNDDPTEYYESVQVTPVSKTTPDDTLGTTTGHGVKLSVGGTQPTEAQWGAIDYAEAIDLSDIGASGSGDTSSYLSFWYRVEAPAGAPADNMENIVLRLSYVASAV